MQVTVQFVNTHKRENVEELVRRKLEKTAEKYSWLIRADVFFKEEKADEERGKICEIRLSAPGPRLFAQASKSNFENAVSETIDELDIQLKKRKSEMYAK